MSPRKREAWFAKHKVVPINHMMVVSQALSDKHPEAVREVHRLLAAVGGCIGFIAAFQRG